jgi:hypothetical protein
VDGSIGWANVSAGVDEGDGAMGRMFSGCMGGADGWWLSVFHEWLLG